MLRNKEGFERATGDEAIGAVVGLIVTGAAEGWSISVASSMFFTDASRAGEANVGQPSKDTASPSAHFSTAEAVGAAALPLLGAALGAMAVSRLRGSSFRRAKRQAEEREEIKRQQRINKTMAEEDINGGLATLQYYANTN